jgi:hypothetical protein
VKQITRELIEHHFDTQKHIRHRWWGTWLVDFESGASAKITRKGVDFGKYRELENRSDIDEGLFQGEARDALFFADDLFGGLGLYGKCSAEDRATVLDFAARVGIDTGDQGLVYRHLGPEATIHHSWGGVKVNVPKRGYFVIRCGALEKVCGDLLRPALLLTQELALDEIVVRGKADLVVMAHQEARALGITIVPESDLGVFNAILGNVIVYMILAFLWLDLLPALLAGYVAGYFLSILLLGLFHKQVRDMARRKGMEMVGLDSAIAVRKASIEEARRNGMI